MQEQNKSSQPLLKCGQRGRKRWSAHTFSWPARALSITCLLNIFRFAGQEVKWLEAESSEENNKLHSAGALVRNAHHRVVPQSGVWINFFSWSFSPAATKSHFSHSSDIKDAHIADAFSLHAPLFVWKRRRKAFWKCHTRSNELWRILFVWREVQMDGWVFGRSFT